MSDKPLISFDYAIKHLLRNKGDHEIIEGFLSALLATEGYKPVKINALLESESNKESLELKKSIADLVVEDSEGNKYIVEIERSFTSNFMHKACFNTSRLVVDSIAGNQDYTTIKKVFHISLLYFATKEITSPLYHGQTIVHSVERTPVDLRVNNQSLILYQHRNMFPEYFFISIPRFNEVIRDEIDEWLYVMKKCEVRDDFKSPYMEKVKERLSVLKMTETERMDYYKYGKETAYSQDILLAAEEKGKREGIEEAQAEIDKAKIEADRSKMEALQKSREIARNMLVLGVEKNIVMQATLLSEEEIDGLESQVLLF